jgi:hypothetical protein
VYNAPTHLMLGSDPVAQNRKRFADIGVVGRLHVLPG